MQKFKHCCHLPNVVKLLAFLLTASLAAHAVPEKADNKSLASLHFHLAESYIWHWHPQLALLELRQAIVLWPNFQTAHRDLALLEVLTGHPTRALAELMMVVGLGEAIPLNESEKSQLHQQTAAEHYKLGMKYETQKRWREAIQEFNWALTYTANNASIYHSLAFSWANLGNFNQAEQFYLTTFRLNPSDAYPHADFAILLSENGNNIEAKTQLSQAVKLDPSAAALHVDLGWIAESGGDLTTAEHEFRRALELSPSHASLWAHMGRILKAEGKNNEALEAYSQALRIKSSL